MQLELCELSPAHWKRLTITSVCERFTSGGTPSRKKSEYFDGGTIPWVKTQELTDCLLSTADEAITEEAVRNSSAKVLPTNTVLMAMYGATVGQLGILGKPMACNQACAAMVVDEGQADHRFLYYQLLASRAQIKSLSTGAAQQNLSGAQIKQFVLPFPPLVEQRAIADVLWALDRRVDSLHQAAATLESIANAIFSSWFIGFDPVRAKSEGREPEGMSADIAALFPSEFVDSELGPIPKGWRIGPISELCERVESGGTPKRGREEFWGGEIPWLTSGEVRSPIVFDTKECVTALGISNSSAKVWPSGTTVVAMYGATAGEACLLAAPLSANQACCGLLPKVGARSLLFFMTRTDRELLASKSTGSAQQNLNKSIVENHPVIVPSDQIISAYEKVVGVLLDRWAAGEQQVRILASIRDTFLPRLLSGAIKVA